MTENNSIFLVNITILEGSHYAWSNVNTYVEVRVRNNKKTTPVRESCDNPFYNEYFVYEIFTTFDKLLDYQIKLTVMVPGTVTKRKKILGYFSLDVATVWAEKDHQFFNKWAILSPPPGDPIGGTRGYLKVNIAILAKEESPIIPTSLGDTSKIEENLLLPEGTYYNRQKAKFLFHIYRAENLVGDDRILIRNSNVNTEDNVSGLDTYVEITFAGIKVKTTTKKNTAFPIFNEDLTINEMFPPLSQRIMVKLHFTGSVKKSGDVQRYINLNSISNSKENGFLPTFGPSYLHFYTTKDGFVGSLLLSIETILLDAFDASEKIVKDAQLAYKYKQYVPQDFENVVLFAAIFDVTAISKKYKSNDVSFRLSIGNVNAQDSSRPNRKLSNQTVEMRPEKINDNLYYLPIKESKPCAHLHSSCLNLRKRMYNSNMLEKIVHILKQELDEIEDLATNDNLDRKEIESRLSIMMENFQISSRKYIDILRTYNLTETALDRKSQKLLISELEGVSKEFEEISQCKTKYKSVRKITQIVTSLEYLIENPQDSLPDIFLSMLHGGKKVTYHRIPARKIVYSNVSEETGSLCGVVHNIFMKLSNEVVLKSDTPIQTACKISVMFWLCCDRFVNSCLKSLIPAGFQADNQDEALPDNLIATETHKFKGLAHIFQGRFIPGGDRSGLCDPFVEVVVESNFKQTQIVKATLNPIWDETLIFEEIILYGTKNFIKNHPPQILMEVLDQDELFKTELVGRATGKPAIKFVGETYSPPDFPPLMIWHKVYHETVVSAEILGAFELLEIRERLSDVESSETDTEVRIPTIIKPDLENFKVEILFWGMRNLKKIQLVTMNKPRITVNCMGHEIQSDTIKDARKNSNFSTLTKCLEAVMPAQEVYIPPLTIKLQDSRNFGIYIYSGTHIINVDKFIFKPLQDWERQKKLTEVQESNSEESSETAVLTEINKVPQDYTIKIVDGELISELQEPQKDKFKWPIMSLEEMLKFLAKKRKKSEEEFLHIKHRHISRQCILVPLIRFLLRIDSKNVKPNDAFEEDNEQEIDYDSYDWWTKFYASTSEFTLESKEKSLAADQKHKLKIYPNELELQPEFHNFTDMLQSFPFYKGKRRKHEKIDDIYVTGIFKGSLRLYKWPSKEERQHYVNDAGFPLELGYFQSYPSNKPLRYLLRVYCVRALGLRPKDLSGKSDPYLVVTLGQQVINDKKNCVMRQLNPVFGRCFEFNAIFPNDHTLTVAVWDWDATTSDDLIGETTIDLENRYYTFHRAECGLADTYKESGYCRWRDRFPPSYILHSLCQQWNLQPPEYTKSAVRVASHWFCPKAQALCRPVCEGCTQESDCPQRHEEEEEAHIGKEALALSALNRWRELPVVGRDLVPEHVETRSLYNKTKPGIEQGKLQLWIDIFPYSDLPPPRPVDITPRKPVKYELRVIIWNTRDIPLNEDDYFAGERKSDIYVKGWMVSPSEAQYTDVHYRSLSGEGNFNWRFRFPFEYMVSENKLVYKKKDTVFALEETEYKIPCKINLQVWDNDTFSPDDFLGYLTMELAYLPRGAPNAKNCNYFANPKTFNLFRIKRTRGWWSFVNKNNIGRTVPAGKLEAEFELITEEEAKENPVGLARDNPKGLPKPNRPDTSFSWFRNPLRALKYVICHSKKKCCCCLCLIMIILFGVLLIYSFPNVFLQKIMGLIKF